jgi:hypothetical protein
VQALVAWVWHDVANIEIAPAGFAACAVFLGWLWLIGACFAYRLKQDAAAAAIFAVCTLLASAIMTLLLSHLALSLHRPRIDDQLAQLDRSLGIYWPGVMAWAAAHPHISVALSWVYLISGLQAAGVIAVLATSGRIAELERFCLVIVVSGLVTILLWMPFPSFGAITVYGLSKDVAASVSPRLGPGDAHGMIYLWQHGPGYITFVSTKGLVGFPSYHTAEAIISTWATHRVRWAFWPFVLFNIAVMISIPIHGGHHVVDMFGGIGVAAASITLAARLEIYLRDRSGLGRATRGAARGVS